MIIASLDLASAVVPAAAVMAAAFGLTPAEELQRRDIFAEHASHPGLIARGAFDGPTLTGFCYGFPAGDRSWWERQVHPRLAAAGAASWLSPDTLELTELHVHPAHQGHGLGRTLITAVCDASPASRVLLSVRVESTAARHLYATLGFTELTPAFPFNGIPPHYLLMGASQPLLR
ncbi:GNAT family N-acetyltransferase [Catenuloplanes atrovinosus]|uniref:Ribosomal protein S18 acetylase RimI-like enzyme n=1 Tax=Catenuloplanes atrovinosus TaxID=137266 RepID=A0AAE4CBF2_9ACTN|nr:GNAT family N-acetyltransferase [Catenuloplanes atrovinosus]MDR7278621.1 ribosomal protein S18 acetylase RimI-like enzyme [Catenuloplanes atrovinosus]